MVYADDDESLIDAEVNFTDSTFAFVITSWKLFLLINLVTFIHYHRRMNLSQIAIRFVSLNNFWLELIGIHLTFAF